MQTGEHQFDSLKSSIAPRTPPGAAKLITAKPDSPDHGDRLTASGWFTFRRIANVFRRGDAVPFAAPLPVAIGSVIIHVCRNPASLSDHRQAPSMKTPRLVALIVVVGTAIPCLAAEPLPRSTPESQGVSSAAVLEFIEAADKNIDSMNSFMLVRHGHVVAEGWWAPYAPRRRTRCTH